jgi:predicted ATPase
MKITSIRIRHFKAVQDSGTIKLGPLTAFVGYNGTGKSSVIEACEFFQTYALSGMESAILPWFSLEHVLWRGAERKRQPSGPFFAPGLSLSLNGRALLKTKQTAWKAQLQIGEIVEGNSMYPSGSVQVEKDALHFGTQQAESVLTLEKLQKSQPLGRCLGANWAPDFESWMFLSLDPTSIGQPRRRAENRAAEPLHRSGDNLADVLNTFLKDDPDGFNALVGSLRHILPYAANLSPEVVRDMVETRSLFRLTEAFPSGMNVPLPGWVLSGGTLRLLALLAALRHPAGPSVLFIEELENGLDPRAIGFVVDEIRSAVTSGEKQVILTTHSPYLLDKLSLDHIVTVERPGGGPPVFKRPAEEKELRQWAEKFAPGSLYSMGMLRSKAGRTR